MRSWKFEKRKINKEISKKQKIINTLEIVLLGIVLGIFSKYIEVLPINEFPKFFEILDIPNFLSDFPFWLCIAIFISVYSASPKRASVNVFLFFCAMIIGYYFCYAYYGYNLPRSYILIWTAFTFLSPILAYITWYTKGEDKISLIVSVLIITVMFIASFAMGAFYIDIKSPLHTITFVLTLIALWRKKILENVMMIGLGVAIGYSAILIIKYLF